MKKKTPQKDVNENAFEILQALTGEPAAISRNEKPANSSSHNGMKSPRKKSEPEKNPAAVALGRLGGLKGGKARAKSLSPKKRAEIAKKAAQTRWKSKKSNS